MALEDLGSQPSSGNTYVASHPRIDQYHYKMSPKKDDKEIIIVAIKMLSRLYFWRAHTNIETHLDRTLLVAIDRNSLQSCTNYGDVIDFYTCKFPVESNFKHSKPQGENQKTKQTKTTKHVLVLSPYWRWVTSCD